MIGLAARRVWLVLPAYNEAANLQPLLDSVETVSKEVLSFHVLVVDDGSNDNTASVAKAAVGSLPVDVVRHEQNFGLAAAVRTGIREVCQRAESGDAVVIMDADNSHSPELIPEMLSKLDGGCDIVIASRFAHGAKEKGFPWKRRVLSRTANLIFRILWPIHGVRDYTTGFRAYRAGLLKELWAAHAEHLIEATAFSVMIEILLKARPLRPCITEIPQVYHYDLKKGPSKMRLARTLCDYVRLFRREFRLRHSNYTISL